jgi:hypothetical protein
VVSFVAGHAAAPSRLTVELGTHEGNVVVPLTRRPVVDPESATSWRGQLLAGPADQAAGADVLRLVARDGETGLGGWLAVTAPELQRPVPLARYLPTDATALASWQLALLFPCLRYPVAADGVVEPPRYALTWAQPPFATLADEATWQVGRAGLGAGARRVAVLVSPASVLRADPEVPWGRVYRFSYPYPTGGYRLDVERETVPGWRAAGPGSQPRR